MFHPERKSKSQKEVDKKDYYFTDQENFQRKINEDFFLEYEEVFGNFYGTPKNKVEESISQGKDVLFDIDWQGTRRLTSKAREDIVSVFILPPSMSELKRRLISRGQDKPEIIEKRMARATAEISHWNEYDYVIINENIDASLQNILYILKSERLKRTRQHSLGNFVDDLLS